jgi:transketolase
METAECWALAVQTKDKPSILALTRQAVPPLRADAAVANHCARGGYIIRPAQGAGPGGERKGTILATGSEVSIAVDAQALLAQDGIHVAVASLPCWTLFDQQSEAYRKEVLGDGVRVAVEAMVPFGWERYLGPIASAPRRRAPTSTSTSTSRPPRSSRPSRRAFRAATRPGLIRVTLS